MRGGECGRLSRGCDPVVGTPASEYLSCVPQAWVLSRPHHLLVEGLCLPVGGRAVEDCSSLGSVDMFFVGGDVATGVGSRRTELLGGPPGRGGGLCVGELVQVAGRWGGLCQKRISEGMVQTRSVASALWKSQDKVVNL